MEKMSSMPEDVAKIIVRMNDIEERFVICNIPFSQQERVPERYKITLSRNVLRDPVQYVKMTVDNGRHPTTHTVVLRSRQLFRRMLNDQLNHLLDVLPLGEVYYAYGQDTDLDGIQMREVMYTDDDEERIKNETDFIRKTIDLTECMMNHTAKPYVGGNFKDCVNNEIKMILMNDKNEDYTKTILDTVSKYMAEVELSAEGDD